MTKKNEIEMVDVDSLVSADFNPKGRTQNIKALVKSMEQEGFWETAPIILGSDGKIGDGHRRVSAAKLVGIREVPCIRSEKPSHVEWKNRNSLAMKLGSSQIMEAFEYCQNPEIIPNSAEGEKVKDAYKEFGLDIIRELLAYNRGISVVEWSRHL